MLIGVHGGASRCFLAPHRPICCSPSVELERERGREGGRESDRERESKRERVRERERERERDVSKLKDD